MDGRGSSAGMGVASSFRQRRAARDLPPESRGVRPSSQRHGTASRRRNRSAVQCHVQHQTNTVCRMDVAAVRPRRTIRRQDVSRIRSIGRPCQRITRAPLRLRCEGSRGVVEAG